MFYLAVSLYYAESYLTLAVADNKNGLVPPLWGEQQAGVKIRFLPEHGPLITEEAKLS